MESAANQWNYARAGSIIDGSRCIARAHITTACTRPRISLDVIAKLAAAGAVCAAGDAGREASSLCGQGNYADS